MGKLSSQLCVDHRGLVCIHIMNQPVKFLIEGC